LFEKQIQDLVVFFILISILNVDIQPTFQDSDKINIDIDVMSHLSWVLVV